MATLRFFADMNISPRTVRLLREQGWDILRVSEVLPASAKDLEVLEFARRERRVVITQDLDFSVLLALSGYSSPSLLLPCVCPFRSLKPLPGGSLRWFLRLSRSFFGVAR